METKIALITGGSRGLGKNAALRLAEKGHDIIITYNTKKDEAHAVVSEVESLGQKATALQLNMEDVSSLDGFIQRLTGTLQQHWNGSKFDFLVTMPVSAPRSRFRRLLWRILTG